MLGSFVFYPFVEFFILFLYCFPDTVLLFILCTLSIFTTIILNSLSGNPDLQFEESVTSLDFMD